MSQHRYFQFPLMLLKDLYLDYKKAMDDILVFSVVDFALKQDVDDKDAAKQALYSYYRKKGLTELIDSVDFYVEKDRLTYDDHNIGFTADGKNFNPVTDEILHLFEEDFEFKGIARLNCQLSKIESIFGVKGLDYDQAFERHDIIKSTVKKHEEQFGNEPMPTVERNLFFDFREEYSPLLFSAYMAIRSIQGQNYFCATTKNVILMRMLGAKSNEALQAHLEIPEIRDIHQKISRSDNALRYHFKKLFNRLQDRGLLKSKTYDRRIGRKIFMSTRLDYGQLTKRLIEQINRKNHKQKEKEAAQKILDATQLNTKR